MNKIENSVVLSALAMIGNTNQTIGNLPAGVPFQSTFVSESDLSDELEEDDVRKIRVDLTGRNISANVSIYAFGAMRVIDEDDKFKQTSNGVKINDVDIAHSGDLRNANVVNFAQFCKAQDNAESIDPTSFTFTVVGHVPSFNTVAKETEDNKNLLYTRTSYTGYTDFMSVMDKPDFDSPEWMRTVYRPAVRNLHASALKPGANVPENLVKTPIIRLQRAAGTTKTASKKRTAAKK